jgi:hypothetical protein
MILAAVAALAGCATPAATRDNNELPFDQAAAVATDNLVKQTQNLPAFLAKIAKRYLVSVDALRDANDLKPGDMILVRWQPGTTKRARFVRLTKAGDLVANIQAVDAKGAYLKKFGSDRTFRVADYAGRAT